MDDVRTVTGRRSLQAWLFQAEPGDEDVFTGFWGIFVKGEASMSGRKFEVEEETIGKLEALTDIESKGVKWLWPQRIAAGSLTLLAGEADVGKSILALDLAARVSCGGNWPDGRPNGVPGGVLLVSAVNHREYTVRPILETAGADLDQIRVWSEVQVARRSAKDQAPVISTRPVNLMKDLEVLAKMIDATPNCRLVVIDPIASFLGTGAKLQSVLLSLVDLAARTGVAIVGITHLKEGGRQTLDRVACNTALITAARAVWLLARDRENPERRLFLAAKSNLTAERTGLALELTQDEGAKGPRVEWEGNVEVMAGVRGQESGVNAEKNSECGTRSAECGERDSEVKAGVRNQGFGVKGEKDSEYGTRNGDVQQLRQAQHGQLRQAQHRQDQTKECGTRELPGEKGPTNGGGQNVIMSWKKRKKLKMKR